MMLMLLATTGAFKCCCQCHAGMHLTHQQGQNSLMLLRYRSVTKPQLQLDAIKLLRLLEQPLLLLPTC
jgi:hypothetical protein